MKNVLIILVLFRTCADSTDTTTTAAVVFEALPATLSLEQFRHFRFILGLKI